MNFKELMENKLFKMLAIVIAIIIVIIVVIVIIMSISGGRSSSYSSLEEKLISAAKSYYEDNTSDLPSSVGSTSEVDSSTLASEGYMKELAKIAPKGSSCSGRVVVKNVNQGYFYQAFLNCGDDYGTTTMSDYIKSKVSTVSIGAGLYENSGNLIYRGENPNNYIKFAGRIYRIVQINNDGTIQIIATEKQDSVVWDDRYNQDRDSNDGINDYNVSRVRDSLLALVNSDLFTDKDRSMLEPYSLCIGKVSEDDIVSLGAECSTKLDGQVIGLLPISSFIYASLDPSCRAPLDGNCQNYNYLHFEYNWWTLTADSNSSYRVFVIEGDGSGYPTRAASTAKAREVLRLTENVVYVGGNGTLNDPYIVK